MDLYVKLHPSSDPKAFANQLKELPERIGVNKEIELRTLPIREIRHHLNEDTPFTLNFIGLFVVSGALLLFAALFNFFEFLYGSLSATCAGMAFTDGQRRNEKAIDRTKCLSN